MLYDMWCLKVRFVLELAVTLRDFMYHYDAVIKDSHCITRVSSLNANFNVED